MAYNKDGISESLLKKLSSAKNTAQSSIKAKKYDTSNISASLAQKLGLESADARVSVSNSGGAAVNLNSSENVAKTKKFLKENPTYMYDGKSLVKNPQAEKAIKDLKDYKNAVRIMGKNVTNFAGGNTLDDAYNLAKNKKQKEIDTQLKLENDYKHITTYEQAKKEAEKATDETTKNYLLNKAQGLKTRSDYESEIAPLQAQMDELKKRKEEYSKLMDTDPIKGTKLYDDVNKEIEELSKKLAPLKNKYSDAELDLSRKEYEDFTAKDPKALSTFELLYNIEESKKQNTANSDEAVHDKFEVNELYTDEEAEKAQNALKELEKKYGKETIDKHFKWFKRVKEEDKNSYNLEITKERAQLNPVLGFFEARGANAGTLLNDIPKNVGVWIDKNILGGDGYIDINASNAAKARAKDSAIIQSIDNPVGKWLYENVASTSDSLVEMAVRPIPIIGPALSRAMSYSRGMSHSFIDAYERTGNIDKAVATGIASGFAESIGEEASIGRFLELKNLTTDNLKKIWANLGITMAVNATEEQVTEIIDIASDYLINQESSNIILTYQSYLDKGLSEKGAWKNTLMDYGTQILEAGAGGAFGGAVFGGIGSGLAYKNYRNNTKTLNTSSKEMGQAVIDSGMDAVEEVISNGLKSKNGKVNKLANKLDQVKKSGKKVDASDIGNLLKLQETDSVNVEEVVNAGLQEKVDTPAYNLAVTLKEQLNKGETIAINHIRALERELGLKKVSQATDDGAVEYKKGDVKVTISSTLHPNGLYAQTKKGKKVIIAQVESADSKNNSAKILTTDGAVFDIDDLTITDPNYKALLVMTPNLDTNGAKALVANYEKAIEEVGEISGSEYAEHFYNLYEASKDGITFEQAKNVPNLQISINHIGTYTSVLAMRSAQNDINPLTRHWKNSVELVKEVTVNDNAIKLKSGHIYADENVDVKNTDISNQLAILDGLAKKANIDIVLSSTLSDYENGRYEDGRIIINANKPSEYIASVVMHEVGHDIKANNPDAFETLTDFVLDYLKAKNVDIEQRITQIKRQYKRVFNPDTAREMATEELVCNTLMSIPSEQEAMNVLSEMDIKEKRSLLKALKDFIQRIKNYLKKHGLIETKAFTDDFEAINKLANMVNESIVRERSALETSKHSFAGVNSLNKNHTLFEEAIQMEIDGFSSEDIRQQTGWFKSYDGKWRYEIDDSQSILIEKPALTKHTDEDGETYFTGKLSDILNHNNLYEAYPQLRDINIIIQTTNVGTSGIYSAKSNYITLNLELFKRHTKEYSAYLNGNRKAEIERIEQTPEYKEYSKWHEDNELMESMDPVVWLKEEEKARKKFFDSELGKRYYQLQWGKYNGQMLEFGWSKGAKSVLMHEIQHAIQYIEGFTSGSSPEYWYKKKLNQYRNDFAKARTEFLKLYDNASEELKNALDVVQESHNRLDVSDSVMNSTYDKAASLIFDDEKLDVLWNYTEAAQNLNGFYKSKSIGESEYRRTAGEIEARDTANRMNYSSKQRKNIRPDIDRMDVVFANDSGIKYSVDDIINSFDIPNNKLGDYIYVQRQVYSTLVKEGFFTDELRNSRTVINKSSGMVIEINKSGIQETFNNNNFSANSKKLKLLKLATIREIPQIIENGKIINDNVASYHKENSSLNFAYIESFLTINEDRIKVVVTIRKSPQKNKFWVHHVYIENDTGSTSAGTSKSSKTAYTTSSANHTLTQTENKVKAKSVNSVVYDENKNATSISKNDIRYSLTEPGEITDAEVRDLFEDSEEAFDYDFTGSNLDFSQDTKEAIQNTNKILADMNRLTKGKKISKEALLKLCKEKVKKYSSKQDADILCRDMQIVLNALEQCKTQDDFNTVFFEMIGLCKNVLDKSMIKVDHFKEERENIKAFLKDYGRIRVDSEQVAETASAFDGWNNYRKQMFGFANLIKSDNPNSYGRPTLDMVWDELCELCPGLCDPDINPLETPMALINLKEKLKPTYEHLYLNMDEQALEMAQELLADIYNAKYENEINAKLDEAHSTYKESLKKQQKKQEERYAKQLKAEREKFSQQKKEHREKMKEAEKLKGVSQEMKMLNKSLVVETENEIKIVEVNAKNPDKVVALYDRKKASEYREKIRKQLIKLARMANKPNKGEYVPYELVNALRNVIKSIAVKEEGQAVPKSWGTFEDLRKAYAKLGQGGFDEYKKVFEENNVKFIPETIAYSKTIETELENMAEYFKGKALYSMSGADLEDTYHLLEAIINNITTARQMVIDDKLMQISKVAFGAINELEAMGPKTDNVAKDLFNQYILSTTSPKRVFAHLANYDENSYIYKLGEMLDKGQDKAIQLKLNSNMIFSEFATKYKKELKELTGEKAKLIDTGIIAKKPIYVTPGMALSIYMHCKNSDNLKHIKNGGITFPDVELYRKGKISESFDKGQKISLTTTELNKICSIVEQNPILLEASKLMTDLFEQHATEINNTTVVLFGYESATVENYFPIHTDSNFLQTDIDALKFDKTLAGSGFLKNRIKASNPVYLEDAFDVVLKQIEQVSEFCGLAIPISNFMKVYNTIAGDYKYSFKSVLKDTWGKKTVNFIEKLITDLQGNKSSYSMMDKGRSNFAQAVLSFNVSVTIKQLAAYPTAASVIGWKPLAKAMSKGVKRADLDLIRKYTPLMWYRDQGNREKGLKDVTGKKKILEKAPALFNWVQKADSAVVGRLWYACEYYVNDNYADIEKGTDDYYMQVAEVFNKMVKETQQNYTTMQSPQILRNKHAIVREITMFMSQNLQEFGMVFEATGNLRAKAKAYSDNKTVANKKALKQAKKQFTRAISAKLVSGLTFSMLTMVTAFLMNRREKYADENGEITLFSAGGEIINDLFANLAGCFIFGSEIYDFIYTGITGDNYYGVGLASLQPVMDLVGHLQLALKSATSGEEVDWYKIWKDVIFDVSTLSGLPVENMYKVFEAGYGHIQNAINGTMLSPDYAKMANSQKAIAMYNALMKGDREKYAKIYNTFIAQGKEDKDIQQYLKTVLSNRNSLVTDGAKAYINNSYDVYENSITELEEIGFATKTIKSAIELKVKELEGDKEETPTETKTYTVDEIFANNTESIYDKDMLWEELIEGNDDNFDMIYSELLESGLTEKQIEQSINSRKRSLVEKYLEAVENSENINAAEYYEQLVNAYGSNSKANKAIREEEKKDKEKD